MVMGDPAIFVVRSFFDLNRGLRLNLGFDFWL
jgi:hypothetical protein